MKMKIFLILLLCITQIGFAKPAITQTLKTNEIQNFDQYPVKTQLLIKDALKLSNKKLTYIFGSANPARGGMDCSGAIQYLLNGQGAKSVPRNSNGLYQYVNQRGHFHSVHAYSLDSWQFRNLKPGDLVFWSGTYNVKNPPYVSHVMMYLGKDKNNRPLLFGSSDGRTYRGKSMRGVSVFDFDLPQRNDRAKFLGYGCIPQITC